MDNGPITINHFRAAHGPIHMAGEIHPERRIDPRRVMDALTGWAITVAAGIWLAVFIIWATG